ncbi:MAG: TIGR04255 family protein [Porticoccaceae bacterium]|nr:MAG: TIGR04255 family protein [Porticoccaceae bacterium]
MNRIPKRLKKEPLIEAIWQVQFEPAPDRPVGDLLPGILYSALRQNHPQLQLIRLPTADIPAPVAQMDPNLRHMAKFRMEEPESSFLFQVGDRIVTLNCRKPYVGWDTFKAEILRLITAVRESDLIPSPSRHTLRYIDLITLKPAPDLSFFQLSIKLGTFDIREHPLQMRLELQDNDCIHVVQIATPAHAVLPAGMQEGTIVDLESYTNESSDWDTISQSLDHLHDRSKAVFFEQILTDKAIEDMEPEY